MNELLLNEIRNVEEQIEVLESVPEGQGKQVQPILKELYDCRKNLYDCLEQERPGSAVEINEENFLNSLSKRSSRNSEGACQHLLRFPTAFVRNLTSNELEVLQLLKRNCVSETNLCFRKTQVPIFPESEDPIMLQKGEIELLWSLLLGKYLHPDCLVAFSLANEQQHCELPWLCGRVQKLVYLDGHDFYEVTEEGVSDGAVSHQSSTSILRNSKLLKEALIYLAAPMKKKDLEHLLPLNSNCHVSAAEQLDGRGFSVIPLNIRPICWVPARDLKIGMNVAFKTSWHNFWEFGQISGIADLGQGKSRRNVEVDAAPHDEDASIQRHTVRNLSFILPAFQNEDFSLSYILSNDMEESAGPVETSSSSARKPSPSLPLSPDFQKTQKIIREKTPLVPWEQFTTGIGSRLLIKMGYKPGEPLSPAYSTEESRKKFLMEPIQLKLYPPRMSLDYLSKTRQETPRNGVSQDQQLKLTAPRGSGLSLFTFLNSEVMGNHSPCKNFKDLGLKGLAKDTKRNKSEAELRNELLEIQQRYRVAKKSLDDAKNGLNRRPNDCRAAQLGKRYSDSVREWEKEVENLSKKSLTIHSSLKVKQLKDKLFTF